MRLYTTKISDVGFQAEGATTGKWGMLWMPNAAFLFCAHLARSKSHWIQWLLPNEHAENCIVRLTVRRNISISIHINILWMLFLNLHLKVDLLCSLKSKQNEKRGTFTFYSNKNTSYSCLFKCLLNACSPWSCANEECLNTNLQFCLVSAVHPLTF